MDALNSLNTLDTAILSNEYRSKMFFEHNTREQTLWVNDISNLWTITIALLSDISLSLLHAFPQVPPARGIVGS